MTAAAQIKCKKLPNKELQFKPVYTLHVKPLDILKDTLDKFPTDRYFWWEGKPSPGVFVATTAGILSHVLLTK